MDTKLRRRAVGILAAVLLAATAVAVPVAIAVVPASPAGAVAPGACGSVLVSAGSWLGGGGVDVHSNGSDEGTGVSCGGNNYVNGVLSGTQWQCVELVNRLYLSKGWIGSTWSGDGDQLFNTAPSNLSKQANGSVSYLGPGDVISINVYDNGSLEAGGHALVVNDSSNQSSGTVPLVSQNAGGPTNATPTGSATISGGAVTVLGGGGGWSYSVIGVIHAPSGGGGPPPPKHTPGDINGDGNADIVMAVPDGSGGVNYEFGLSQGNGHFILGTAVGLTNQPTPVAMATGDINGDGNADIVMAVPDGSGGVNYEFGLSQGNGHFILGTAVGLTNQPTPVAMATGDINGDGNADIVMAVPDGSGGVNYEFGLSQGNGHFILGTAVGLTNQPTPVAMATGDINGDGNADIVMAVPDGSGGVNYEFGLSQGNGHFILGTAVGLTNQPTPVAMASGGASPPAAPLIITSPPSARFIAQVQNSAVVATAYSYPTPTMIEAGALPAGVTFVDIGNGTATISGTPTQSGTYPITITASNGVSPDATQSFTLTVVPLGITTTSLPNGTVKTPYVATLAASGGNPPYKWKLATGSKVPKGLKLSSAGQITGTPKAAGTTTVTIQVTDTKTKTKPPVQHVATATFTITVS